MRELKPPDTVDGWTTEVTCSGCNAQYAVDKNDFDHLHRGYLYGDARTGRLENYNYLHCPHCDRSIRVELPYLLIQEIASRPYPNPQPDPPTTTASCPKCGGSGKSWLRRRCSRCLGEGTIGYGAMDNV